MIVTALVATSGVCTEDILGTLTGIWAYALTYRRPLFSMMFHVYSCYSPDGRRDTPFRLGTWSRNELLLLALLGPFCYSSMRADYDPRVYAADASPFGLGVVSTEIGTNVVAELWRRAEVKGRVRTLLHPLSAMMKEAGMMIGRKCLLERMWNWIGERVGRHVVISGRLRSLGKCLAKGTVLVILPCSDQVEEGMQL